MRTPLSTILVIASALVSQSGCKQTSQTSSPARKPSSTSTTNYDGMILVNGGTFMMGTEDGMPYEAPAHEVTVKSFWMDRHEVTVAEFAEFVSATGYQTEAEKFGWSGAFNLKTKQWEKTKGADWRHPDGPGSPG